MLMSLTLPAASEPVTLWILAIVPAGLILFYLVYDGLIMKGSISIRNGRRDGLIGKDVPDGTAVASVTGTSWIGVLRYHGSRLDVYDGHLVLYRYGDRYGMQTEMAEPLVFSDESVGKIALGKTGERVRLFDIEGTSYNLLFWASDPVPLRRALDSTSWGSRIR